MEPIIALIGHFNVGKSTLFNRLTHTSKSLITNIPGSTRDRKYGSTKLEGIDFILIDTSGIDSSLFGIETYMLSQSLIAIKEADIVLFVVDATTGLINADQKIAKYLYKYNKLVFLVINKINGLDVNLSIIDFSCLGFKNIHTIDAYSGYGVTNLVRKISSLWKCNLNYIKANYKQISKKVDNNIINKLCEIKENIHLKKEQTKEVIKLAIIGRPNVGKSTLINCILGEVRLLVYDEPGTTRDSIYIPIKYLNKDYVLIDTAGIRKRKNINQVIEKFSIVQTLKAIDYSNVVILVINAQEDISHQDYYLINLIIKKGISLVVVINKWDNLSWEMRKKIKEKIKLKLNFINFVRIHFISALYNIGVNKIFKSINESYYCSKKHINTSSLTNILKSAIKNHKPPLIHGNSIKMKYAHFGNYNPFTIIIHGNRLKYLPETYKRYLASFFRKSMNIMGSLIHIKLKESNNPYTSPTSIFNQNQKK
ncbi:ribosome biogenesis GTPase Der [Candidatus Pantoea edessiphila]|uniref:ribosome biogenesis GTPase Der n=1 Tax=Candidatus Pantoea edessiphila TaxID=2044610 RepID=UPI003075E761